MPMGDQYTLDGQLTRSLIYGKDKTKKTWWATRAAEAGFNVILLDGDDGSSIIMQLPVEARKRILVVDLVDTLTRPVFAFFMASFCKKETDFVWDEQSKRSLNTFTQLDPTHSYIRFRPEKLTKNDVIILDSWTSLSTSTLMQAASELDMDLLAVEREGDQFAHLNFQQRYLDFVLSKLHGLPCQIIVIGHEMIWEKWQGKGKDRKLVHSFTQPISSTGPQGAKLGKHFSNVLYFYKESDIAYRIDAGGDDSRAGGSRILAPAKYNWNDVTPQLLFDAVGVKGDPNLPCEGAKFISKGNTSVPMEFAADRLAAQASNVQALPTDLPKVVGDNGGLSLSERIRLRKGG